MSAANFDFSGKRVFVAGGTSGINLGIATNFAKAGATLGVLSRSEEKVAAAVETLSAYGSQASGEAADVREPEAVAAVIDRFGADGPIDVVVSGAAGNFLALAKDLSPNGFRTVVEIDLIGTYNVMKAVYPHMRRPGGSIINVSAGQAYIPLEYQVHACAAKAGVDQVTRTLSLEWGPEGLRVNSIVPGPIQGTEGMSRLAPTVDEKDIGQDPVTRSVPLRRWGTVDDIGQMAMFLSSDAASYVSGAVIPVDGGWGVSGPGRSMISMSED